jgi:hypothetical protein
MFIDQTFFGQLGRFVMKCKILSVVASMVLMLTAIVPAMSDELPSIDPQADAVLQKMSDFLSGQERFTFYSESTVDELQVSGQMIQFARGANVTVKRPGSMVAEVSGDRRSLKFFYHDGKAVLHDVGLKFFAELAVPPTLEKAMPYTFENFNLEAPFAYFIYPKAYNYLTKDVIEGRYLGIHRVLGIPCHHLAFRTGEVDWQVWIDAGEQPLPRKFVRTEKRIAGAPQFTALLTHWDLNPSLNDKTFLFEKPEDAVQIDFLPAPSLTLPQ